MKRLFITFVTVVMSLFIISGCSNNDEALRKDNVTATNIEQKANNKSERRAKFQQLKKEENEPYYGQISSQQTNKPSSKYPHTTAVQIQHAKYAFITVDEKGKQKTITLPDHITKNLPNNIQQLTPEEIVQYLPNNVQKLLPKGSEHLTPEMIAKLIKDSGVKQGTGKTACT